jgi:hypothetical protein
LNDFSSHGKAFAGLGNANHLA